MKKKVAIICGGYSSESIVSMKSGATIFDNLDSEKYDPYIVVLNKKEWSVQINDQSVSLNAQDFSFSLNGQNQKFDVAFITIHGTPGEDGKLQGYFDIINLPYINSGVMASSLTFNKWACNQFLKNFDIPVADSILLKKGMSVSTEKVTTNLGLPCFVKPNDSGSSFGISKVSDKKNIQAAIEQAFKEGEEVIIESFLKGREVTCGAYYNGEQIETLPLTEIVTHNEFFDFKAKYEGLSDEITPARISDKLTTEIQKLTIKIYQTIGLKGLARVDYIIMNEKPYVIEVNTTPGMSTASLIPQQVKVAGKNLSTIFDQVIEVALKA